MLLQLVALVLSSFLISTNAYCNLERQQFDENARETSSLNAKVGPSTKTPPMLDGNPEIVKAVVSLLTVGDTLGSGTPLVGNMYGGGAIMDTPSSVYFHLYVIHSIQLNQGGVRAHGSQGSFISHMLVQRNTLQVFYRNDLVQSEDAVHFTNPIFSSQFRSLSGGEVAPSTAFSNGLEGTTARILLSGESHHLDGRAFAFQLTGAAAGSAFQLPAFGQFCFESIRANPIPQQTTLVALLEDNLGHSSGGLVLFYVGEKNSAGTGDTADIVNAGLTNGRLACLALSNHTSEDTLSPSFIAEFTLHSLDQDDSPADLRQNALDVISFRFGSFTLSQF
jgi:hypothetical protein